MNSITAGLTGLSYVDLRFNRVEGLFAGGKFDIDSVTNSLALRGGLGYSFDDKRWKYSGGATYYFVPKRLLGVGGNVYRKLDNRPDEGYYEDLEILLGSLFSKDDYRDYFLSRGWHGFLEGNFIPGKDAPGVHAQLGYTDEDETSLKNITEYSFFDRDRTYRPNPPIADGTLHALTFNAEYRGRITVFFQQSVP